MTKETCGRKSLFWFMGPEGKESLIMGWGDNRALSRNHGGWNRKIEAQKQKQ